MLLFTGSCLCNFVLLKVNENVAIWIYFMMKSPIFPHLSHNSLSAVLFVYNLSLLIVLNALLQTFRFSLVYFKDITDLTMSENSKYFEIEEH